MRLDNRYVFLRTDIKGIVWILWISVWIVSVCERKATASWNVVHRHPPTVKIKKNNHRILLDYFPLKSFCNTKFFKYPPLGICYSRLYSSYLLTKPSAVQYKLSIYFVKALVLYLFFMFKACVCYFHQFFMFYQMIALQKL